VHVLLVRARYFDRRNACASCPGTEFRSRTRCTGCDIDTEGTVRGDMAEDIWILGIHMTKFGKHPDKDTVDLASEAASARSPTPA
jgi:hypothetical protein